MDNRRIRMYRILTDSIRRLTLQSRRSQSRSRIDWTRDEVALPMESEIYCSSRRRSIQRSFSCVLDYALVC
jgi:hypothetical protein